MDNIDRHGDDIRRLENVENYEECNKKCKEENECYIWTFIEGTCYMKSDNTFNGVGDNVRSGVKDCSSSGIELDKRKD